jgi:hypothetical protein
MPFIGFSLITLGAVVLYGGYLGVKPQTVVSNIITGTPMPQRVGLDPRKQNTTTTANTSVPNSEQNNNVVNA